jgi:hypothetical protein
MYDLYAQELFLSYEEAEKNEDSYRQPLLHVVEQYIASFLRKTTSINLSLTDCMSHIDKNFNGDRIPSNLFYREYPDIFNAMKKKNTNLHWSWLSKGIIKVSIIKAEDDDDDSDSDSFYNYKRIRKINK